MPVIHPAKKPGGFGGGSNIDMVERLLAGSNYLTGGISGIIYTVVGGRFARTQFFRFHFLQSILLWIFGWLLGAASNAFTSVFGGILQMIPGMGPQMIMFVPVAMDIVIKAGTLLLLYGLVMAMMAKEANIPVISKLVRQQLR